MAATKKKAVPEKKAKAKPAGGQAEPVRTKRAKKAAAEAPPSEAIAAPSAEKAEIISQFQVKEGDTGSPEVQVALLTKRIEKLVAHLKSNPGDNHSRRGLLGIVSKRRRLLNYVEKKDPGRYKQVITKIGLK